MSTRTQRDFKRQMKELKKSGKLPENYYAKRRGFQVSGVSLLFILILLWRLGILHSIFYFILSLFGG